MLLVTCQYLALEGLYLSFWAALNLTHRKRYLASAQYVAYRTLTLYDVSFQAT